MEPNAGMEPPSADARAKDAPAPASKRPPRAVVLVGSVALLVGLYFAWNWWRYIRTHVTTDNAYVRADVTPLSARVGGTVSAVAVDDNDAVKKGDVLLRIDVTDFKLALKAAEARLVQAKTQVEVYRASIKQARASLESATAEAERARADLARTVNLASQQVVSRQTLDHNRTAYRVAESQRVAAARVLDSALSALGGNPDLPTNEQYLVRQAQADLDQARLNVSYTTVLAPANGYISQKQVEVGQRIQAGQPLMALVSLDDPYLVANFKETEITKIRIGQPVDIKVDVYPDFVYTGHVAGIDAGTGAAFALLPPQNASGNWVKVVQRVPVKIILEKAPPETHPLRVGLSAEVSVNVTDLSGPLLRAHEWTLRGPQRAESAPRTVPDKATAAATSSTPNLPRP
jgi:membrane fusion protein (multidrug efflux system)